MTVTELNLIQCDEKDCLSELRSRHLIHDGPASPAVIAMRQWVAPQGWTNEGDSDFCPKCSAVRQDAKP
jgi:hypothetical protein